MESREDTMLYVCYVAYTHLLALELPVEVEVVERQSSASLYDIIHSKATSIVHAVQSVTNL